MRDQIVDAYPELESLSWNATSSGVYVGLTPLQIAMER